MKKFKTNFIFIISLMLLCMSLGREVSAEDASKAKVNMGIFHSAVVKTDGSLWMWGSNESGAIGDGTTTYALIPKMIMKDVKNIGMGNDCSAAIKKDGSLWMWGNNSNGELGNGSTVDSYKPIKVMENVKQVELGDDHSAVIKEDGSLWMWGSNENGRLGDGTQINRYKPVKIMEDVKAVNIGRYHSMAIKEDGSLWVWGKNEYGQLGDGTTNDSYTPKKIMDNVKMANAGFMGSVAIKNDGSLWMWGTMEDIQEEFSFTPRKIMDDVKTVSLSSCFIAVIKEDDSLWTWGYNDEGGLGDGTTIRSYVPLKVMEDICQVSTGEYHTAVIKNDGSLWIWGYNGYGQLGIDLLGGKRTVPKRLMTVVDVYTVSYDANGGSGAPEAQTKEQDKALTLRTKKPTRANHVFQGWATSKTATAVTYKPGGTYKANKSVTLYAVWKKKQTITASNKSAVYNCSPFNLNAKASGGGKLTYTSGNKSVATISSAGKVTVKGYGKTTITIKAAANARYLAATKKITVTVKPKKTTLKTVSSPAKKTLSISWKKDTTVTKYELQFSTKKNFSSNTYERTLGAKISSTKVISVPNKRTYYVRIRAYKKVNGTKYYGAWSNVKSVWVK